MTCSLSIARDEQDYQIVRKGSLLLFVNVFTDRGKIEAVLHLEMIPYQAALLSHHHLNSTLSLKDISHQTGCDCDRIF